MEEVNYLKRFLKNKKTSYGIECEILTNKNKIAKIRIISIKHDIFRVQLFPNSNNCTNTNSVTNYDDINKNFSIVEEQQKVELINGKVTITINKVPFKISIYKNKNLITEQQIRDFNADDAYKSFPMGFELDGNNIIKCWEKFNIFSDEYFWGMGEKYTQFNKRGQKITCWQKDALSTNTEASYKNIPFFISSRKYGIFLNTYSKSVFDFGNSSQVTCGIESQDSCLDYYFICGENFKQIISKYSNLTGKTPLIPKWALGLWMSKCTYKTENEVMNVAKKIREDHIPCDVIHIDSWMRDESCGDLIWDIERYPNYRNMIKKLHDMSFKLSVWIWPYIIVGCKRYEEAKQKGFLIKNKNGGIYEFKPIAISNVKVAAFDFTNEDMRNWYKKLIAEVINQGVDVIKTDFGEYIHGDCVFSDNTNDIKSHNKYTYLYSKTVFEGIKKVKNDNKAIIWCRSGYAGSQKYPVHWAGDSPSTLNTLPCIVNAGLSLGLSGISLWAHDMGGFYNSDENNNEIPPYDEEYIRSIQLGFLCPLSRCHGKTPREPWNFNKEIQSIFLKFDNLRYSLIPYLYSYVYKAHESGVPVMRPLILEFPDDIVTFNISRQYMLGREIMIAPVFDQKVVNVYFPDGLWYDFWEDTCLKGGCIKKIDTVKDKMPIFIRDNSIIIMNNENIKFIENEKKNNIKAKIYISEFAEFEYYDNNIKGNIKAVYKNSVIFIETTIRLKQIEIHSKKTIENVFVNGIEQNIIQIFNITKTNKLYYSIGSIK